jgi:hypothetical protein
MNRLLFLFILSISSVYYPTAQAQEEGRPLSVAVIAPSVSTSMESKRIIALQKWTVGKFKTADAILVVVRSSLSNPLRSTYQFIGDLSKDARN